MEVIRFTCYLFVVYQLVENSHCKSISGKTRSATSKAKHKEKALYGKIYEETKHDVNRAIEDAILEASKKATDLVLQPKIQSKLVDSAVSKIQGDLQGSGEEMTNSTTGAEESPVTTISEVKKASKKHDHASPKHATKETKDSATFHIHNGTEGNTKNSDIDSITLNAIDDDEPGASGEPAPKPDIKKVKVEKEKKESKIKKHTAEKKKKEEDFNDVDSSDSNDSEGPPPDSEPDIDSGEKEAPEGEEEEEMEEKSDLVPSDDSDKDAEVKDTKPKIPAGLGKTLTKEEAAAGGQEDLKALLDESINNLVRANSAVEVLLRATKRNKHQYGEYGRESETERNKHQYGEYGRESETDQRPLTQKFGTQSKNETYSDAPLFQSALYPQCEHCSNFTSLLQ